MKNNWADPFNSIHRVSGCRMVLEFVELFWIFLVLEMYLKNPLFQAYSGIVLEFSIFDIQLFRLQHLLLPPVWISDL